MTKLNYLLFALTSSYYASSVYAVTTRWNPDFSCDGCILITTDASLQGTISTGQTITTYTPPVATSVVIPDESTTTTPVVASSDENEGSSDTATNTITSSDSTTPLATIYPTTVLATSTTTSSTQIEEYTSVTIPTDNGSTSQLQTTAYPTSATTTTEPGEIITTFVIGSLTTKTYVITTTTAVVLLVTDTQTYTTVSTVTYSSAVINYSTSTLISPISTFTSTVDHYTGYQNGTSTEVSLALSTDFTSIVSTYQYTSYAKSLGFFTQIYEEIVTSTLIVWGTEFTESIEISSGYQTLVSTIYPQTQVLTITSNATPVIATSTSSLYFTESPVYATTSTTTHTYTVTITPTVTEGSLTTPNICPGVAATSEADQVHVDSVYSGEAKKISVRFNWTYLVVMMFALL